MQTSSAQALWIWLAIFSVVLVSCGDEEVGPTKSLYQTEEDPVLEKTENAYSPIVVLEEMNMAKPEKKTPQAKQAPDKKDYSPKIAKGIHVISKLPSGVYVKTEDHKLLKLKRSNKHAVFLTGKVVIYNSKNTKEVHLASENNEIMKIKPGKKLVFDAGTGNTIQYLRSKKRLEALSDAPVAAL